MEGKKRSIFFDTGLIYFVVIACFVCLRIFTSVVAVNMAGSIILSILIQIGFMLAIPFFMYKVLMKKKTKEVLEDFNFKKISVKAVLYCIALGIIVYFLNLAVASFFNIFITATGYDPNFGMASTVGGTYSLGNFIIDIVITAILPGICEEFCHRGLLVNGYKQLGAKKTIILVGLLFGLMHLNVEQFFYASIIGMFLTFLVYVTGSIIPSMIIHFLNNGIGLYVTFATYNNLPFGNMSNGISSALQGNAFTIFGTIMLIVLILLGLLVFFTYKLLKCTRVNQFEKMAKKAIEKKQRESILKSFDLNVDEVNAEQGIIEDENEPTITIGGEILNNGKRGLILDINFKSNDLMCTIQKKPTLKEKTFLIAVIFLGIIITISTLIWGIL